MSSCYLSDCEGDTLAEKVRKITFVEPNNASTASSGETTTTKKRAARDLGFDDVGSATCGTCTASPAYTKKLAAMRSRLDSHEKNVRSLERIASELRGRPSSDSESREDALVQREEYEAAMNDVVVARQLYNTQLQSYTRLEKTNEEMGRRLRQVREEEEEGICNVCLVADPCLLNSPCFHMTCANCSSTSRCPLCDVPLTEIVAVSRRGGVGTKLREIGELIQSFGQGEGVLLFVQWKSMLRFTRDFLSRMNIAAFILEGKSSHREGVLNSLKHSGGSGGVLGDILHFVLQVQVQLDGHPVRTEKYIKRSPDAVDDVYEQYRVPQENEMHDNVYYTVDI